MKIFAYISVALSAACGYNDFKPAVPQEADIPNATLSIAEARDLYIKKELHINEGVNLIFSGHVTTSDRSNNFYRTFIVEDPTGAIEVRAGLYDMHNLYRVGQQVAVIADGLTIGMQDGMLQLGRESMQPHYEVEYIDHISLLKRHILKSGKSVNITPTVKHICDLDESMVGMLVRINGLKLDPASDTTWALPASISVTSSPVSVNLKFKSSPDDSIYVYTSGYANFAAEKVPRENVDITGILLMNDIDGKPQYQLKIRDLNDVIE